MPDYTNISLNTEIIEGLDKVQAQVKATSGVEIDKYPPTIKFLVDYYLRKEQRSDA